jgi:hypothetical protein
VLLVGRSDIVSGEALDGKLTSKSGLPLLLPLLATTQHQYSSICIWGMYVCTCVRLISVDFVRTGITVDFNGRTTSAVMAASAAFFLLPMISHFVYRNDALLQMAANQRTYLLVSWILCAVGYVAYTAYLFANSPLLHRQLREARRRRRVDEAKARFVQKLDQVPLEQWLSIADRELPSNWEVWCGCHRWWLCVVGDESRLLFWLLFGWLLFGWLLFGWLLFWLLFWLLLATARSRELRKLAVARQHRSQREDV